MYLRQLQGIEQSFQSPLQSPLPFTPSLQRMRLHARSQQSPRISHQALFTIRCEHFPSEKVLDGEVRPPNNMDSAKSSAPEEAVKEWSDTFFSGGSLSAARAAAGGVIEAVRRVFGPDPAPRRAVVIVRPPGHHAGPAGLSDGASSCGFCLFNNVMIACLYAIDNFPLTVSRSFC